MPLTHDDQDLLNLAFEQKLITRRQQATLTAELESHPLAGQAGRLMVLKGYLTEPQMKDLRDRFEQQRKGRTSRKPKASPPAEPPPPTAPATPPAAPPPEKHPAPEWKPASEPHPPQPPRLEDLDLLCSSPCPFPLDPEGTLAKVFQWAVSEKATDLHANAAGQLSVRIAGTLKPIPGRFLPFADLQNDLIGHLPSHEATQLQQTGTLVISTRCHEAFLARIHLFRSGAGYSLAARFQPSRPPTLDALGVPPAFRVAWGFEQGLVLITGPQGSGRTTTLHAALYELLTLRHTPALRIVRTAEYEPGKTASPVTTWRVGYEIPDLITGIQEAGSLPVRLMAVDDLITGEECDAALQLAEKGNLVLAALRAETIAHAYARFIESVPVKDTPWAATQFADVVHGVLSQRLLPRMDGKGVVMIPELLLAIPQAQTILRSARPREIEAAIRVGKRQGMVALDDALIENTERGVLDRELARRFAIHHHLIEKTIKKVGGESAEPQTGAPSSLASPPPSN